MRRLTLEKSAAQALDIGIAPLLDVQDDHPLLQLGIMGFQLQHLFALASGFGELAETLQAVHAPLVWLDLPLLKTAPLTKVQLAFRVAPGTAIPQAEGAHPIA